MVTQSIEMPLDLASRVEAAAKASKRSKTALILEAIEEYLAEREGSKHAPAELPTGPGPGHDTGEEGAARSGTEQILRFAGSWSDMPEREFRDFYSELVQRRRQAGKSRRLRQGDLDT